MSLYNATCDGPIPVPLAPGPACSQPEVQGLPFCDTSLTYEERIADLISRLELEEYGPLLTARNSPAVPRLGIPAFYWGTNMVHGITNAVSGGELCTNITGRCVTIFPSGPALGASWNATAWRLLGATAGREMRALGNIQWGPSARPDGMDGLTAWGPTINVVRDPRWGRIQEVPGEDPLMNGIFAREVTRGLQEGEDPRYLMAVSTLKHFAVYSLEDYYTSNGTHLTRENINNVASQAELHGYYYPHFQTAVSPVAQGGGAAGGVMMAMNAVNGIPSLASSELINTLKGWSGPNSLYVTTDGINMIDSMLAPEPEGHFFCPYHAPPCTRAEGIAAAVIAGSDIADGNEYQQTLIDAINGGNITVGDAQQRLFNTFMIRFRLGLFDPTEGQPYLTYGAQDINTDSARAANLLAAQEGLVLLQNANSTLPLPRGQGTTLVVGFAGNSTQSLVSNYVNQFCFEGGDSCYPSIVQAMQALGEQVVFAQGCNSPTDCPANMIAAAQAAAASSSVTRVVMVLGIGQGQEAEQRDRENITLPSAQTQLFGAVRNGAGAKPVAVVLVHGGALAIPDIKASGVSILDAFYPGPAGGQAIANALFGLYNPGGKLPYTVYDAPYQQAVDMADMRVAANGRTYLYHTDASPGGPALWNFGYGLSYTTFSLSLPNPPAPSATALTPSSSWVVVTAQVANTGAISGDEVLQAYFAPNATSLAPPVPPYVPIRQLFDFQRVRLDAGASVQIPVNVTASALLSTLSDGTRKPVDGTYTIIFSRGQGVGPESTVTVTLQGF